MSELPAALARELGRWHDAEQTALWVAALEAHGVRVAVLRLRLGDYRAEGFGRINEVYRSKESEADSGEDS